MVAEQPGRIAAKVDVWAEMVMVKRKVFIRG